MKFVRHPLVIGGEGVKSSVSDGGLLSGLLIFCVDLVFCICWSRWPIAMAGMSGRWRCTFLALKAG